MRMAMNTEKLLFYEALVQQLHDDGLDEAASLIEQNLKVEANNMLRHDHLYELFKNTAYLSSRVVAGASSDDPAAEFQRRQKRLHQILDEATTVDNHIHPAYKVVGFSEFSEFPTYRPCRCIAESHDASLLATGGMSGALHVIPTVETDGDIIKRKPNGHNTMKIQGHQGQVNAIDFHPRRNIVASGGADTSILIHDIGVANGYIHTAAEIQLLNDSSPIRCLRFHPCGDFLYAGTGNSIMRLYDIATKVCYTSSHTRRQHQGGGINGCDVLHCGGLVFTAGGDGSVIIWDGKNLDVLHALEDVHGGSPVLCVRCDRYGRYVLSSGHDGSTKITDLRMMREVLHLTKPDMRIQMLTIGGGNANQIRTVSDFMSNPRYIATLSITQSGRRTNSDVTLYNIDTGYKEVELSSLLGRRSIANISASKHEMLLYILTEDGSCKVINFFDPYE